MPGDSDSSVSISSSFGSSSDEDVVKGGRHVSKMSSVIVKRPNASNGFWLCGLLPAALLAQYARQDTLPSSHHMLTIAAGGMCVESLCFFIYMFLDTGLFLKLVISVVPGVFTWSVCTLLLGKTWGWALFWGFAITFCYQSIYIRVLRRLQRCFTFGEAAVLVQGLTLFLFTSALRLPTLLLVEPPADDVGQLNVIVMWSLSCLFATCWLLATFRQLRTHCGFYLLMALLLLEVTLIPINRRLPIVTLARFIINDESRLRMIGFYFVLVGLTILSVFWQLRHNSQKASTSVRKVFHFLIILVYVPGLIHQCLFLYIASAVVFAICTVLELARILNIPPFGAVLRDAFTTFSDEKDASILALTPFCLLIGCSLPLWLQPFTCEKQSNRALLLLMSGILTIGFGDSAASIVGSKLGRTKWKNSNRTVEGSVAFVVATLFGVFVLQSLSYIRMSVSDWLAMLVSTTICALVEAQTDQIDNLVLPLVFYICLSVC